MPAMLVTALGMIDMGTTAIVDMSQVSHTPEHSDACIRALQESGIRAVHSYHRGAGPDHRYPQDIMRLQRTYFSSKDQLLTLALTAVSTRTSSTLRARSACRSSRIWSAPHNEARAGARARRAAASGR